MTDTADRLSRALADRYRIVREVGAGGMATVYLAEDLRHHREVALKVLRPELAATMGPERFFREIQVAARLQHPHILPLHDSGEADGFLYFVMPFVTGESLRTRIDRMGELPVPDVVRILTQVADALSYSHSQGVVHRDIKPDNVMLSGRHALVTDFGVAKAVREAAGERKVTTAGVALGTPAYMAPEQAAADPQLDHRVDLYAFGVLGYELLTGRTPFHGLPPQQQLLAHVTETPAPVRKWRESCPAELEAIVMRCLQKKAADRFQSADELLQALEPLAGTSGGITPTQSRPASGAVPTVPASRRPLAFVGAFVAIAASLAVVLMGGREKAPNASYVRTQLTASGQVFRAMLSPDGQRLAHGERTCGADGLCSIELRVVDVSGVGSSTLVRGLVGLGYLEWTDDGRWLVYGGATGEQWGVFAVPAIGGAPRYLGCCAATVGRGDTVQLAGIDADGLTPLHRLTIGEGRTVDSLMSVPRVMLAWDLPGTDRILAVVRNTQLQDRVVVIDPDGTARDSLVIPGLSPYRFPLRIDDEGFAVLLPDSTGDGRRASLVHYAIDRRGRIARTPTVRATGVSTPIGGSVAADGRTLAVHEGVLDRAIWHLEREAGPRWRFRERQIARATTALSASITPAGDLILVVRERPTTTRTNDMAIRDVATGTERPLASVQDAIDWDFTQDGRGVLLVRQLSPERLEVSELDVATGRSRIIDAVLEGDRSWFETVVGGGYVNIAGSTAFETHGIPGRPDTTIRAPAELSALSILEPSPDGASVAIAGWDRQGDYILVHVVDLRTGAARPLARIGAEGVESMVWLADGTLLLSLAETSWNNVLHRIHLVDGRVERLDTPLRIDASFRFARDGRRGVARENGLKADVFLMRPDDPADR